MTNKKKRLLTKEQFPTYYSVSSSWRRPVKAEFKMIEELKVRFLVNCVEQVNFFLFVLI